MNHTSYLLLKGLKFSAIATIVASASTYAYEQGKGSVATVNPEDKVEKIDTLTASSADERIKGEFNRSGNPVRVIWYGNPNDQDGKVAQTGANNQGHIVAKVMATGQETTDSEDRRGAISIDGVANGIDALGWSSPSNVNDVEFALQSVDNSGTISAEANLRGGVAETHGDIQSYGSGNGISIIGLADFGKHNASVGADGIADGYSGATSVSRRSSASRTTRVRAATSAPSSPALDQVDFKGKTADVSLQNVQNSGQISGKIYAEGASATPHTADYKPQFYSVTSVSSGNAVSASAYVNTIDKYTYSEAKKNFAKLGDIDNRGDLTGEAVLLGGKQTTHTGTVSSNSGNGISALATTGRFAKNRTEAAVGNIQNSGQIAGKLTQISGDNSAYRGVHLYSDAETHGSGNAVSVTTVSSNAQNRYASTATIGNIDNSGKMSGEAVVKAGNGTGTLMASAVSTGNGVSVFAKGNSGEVATVGGIDNSGMILGQLEVRGGKSDSSQSDRRFVPDITSTNGSANQPSSSTTSSNRLSPEECKWLSPTTPGCEPAAAPTTPSYVDATVQSATTVHSSGNGITAWSYGESSEYGQQKARIGNVINAGTISGYANVWQGFSQDRHTRVDYRNNGAGITVNAAMNGSITNAGIISGNHSALLARGKIDNAWSISNPTYRSGFKGGVNNYGILAGRLIVGGYELDSTIDQNYRYFETSQANNVKNAGIYITLDKDENIEKVTLGTDNLAAFTHNGKTYTVQNAPLQAGGKDSEKVTTAETALQNTIINGVGMANGAFFAKHNSTLTNSIINGYKTALKVGENSQVTLDNTILNANGFKVNQSEKPLAILGDSGTNTLTLANRTLINGDIDLKAGDDELIIADGQVKFNGQTIDLGDGQDKLQFGKTNGSTAPLHVGYAINNAEDIVVNQPTHLLANAKIRGTNTLTLNSDLHYHVLSPEMHALFDSQRTQKLALNGVGKFIVETTRAASEYAINFGGFQLDPTDITFATNNVLQDAVFKDGKLLIQPKVVITAEEAAKQAEKQAQLEAQLSQAEKQKTELENALQATANERDQEKANLTAEAAKQAEKQAQLEAQLSQAEKQKAELENALQAAANERDQEKANLTSEAAKQAEKQAQLEAQLSEAEKQKTELENALQAVANERDQEKANTNTQTTQLEEQLAGLQQKIDQLNAQIAAQKQAVSTFETPFAAAYQSYLTSWKATGVNPLEASALTTDKSAQQATQAVNRYLAETVEHNIYGAIADHFAKMTADERNALLAMLKRLNEGQWYVATKGIHSTQNYRETADKATNRSALLSVHYGLKETLTAGLYVSTHKQSIHGGQSHLNGKGLGFGAYLSQHFDNLSLTAGITQGQTNVKGVRTISNGYDHHQFDANTKVKATSVYVQAKYALSLNDNWQFVPRAELAYTRLMQNAIKESGAAALTIDAYRSQRLESRIGQDLIVSLPTSNGKASLKFSADYTLTSGEKALRGRFQNGDAFTIRTEPNRQTIGIGSGIGYEWRNGVALAINARKTFSPTGNNTLAEFKLGYTFK